MVIHPAIPGNFANVPWNARKNDFVCLGRISPEKKIERIISMLDNIRARGHKFSLHLIGTIEGDEYSLRIMELCKARQDWIFMHGALYGEEKVKILSRSRYGINACDREAFGISTAEMMKAGIIPFVPACSAQTEIVREPALAYKDDEDAIIKIDAVLNSESSQIKLHELILKNSSDFRPERFFSEVCRVVKNELARISSNMDSQ